MYSSYLSSTFRDPVNISPSYNVLLTPTLKVSRFSEQPTKSQCIPCTYLRCFEIRRTVRQVAMYPSQLFSTFRDLANNLPSRNVFLTLTLDVSRPNEQPAKSQCIPCTYFRCFEIRRTARQVTTYPSQLFSTFRDLVNNLSSHNVFLASSLDASRPNEQPAKSQCIPCTYFRCFET